MNGVRPSTRYGTDDLLDGGNCQFAVAANYVSHRPGRRTLIEQDGLRGVRQWQGLCTSCQATTLANSVRQVESGEWHVRRVRLKCSKQALANRVHGFRLCGLRSC